ncbi:MAG: hypothetical protein JO306_00475 [Gemmatimonadetes bacterium]|nr:hypothetical protein [Gemmatimonadota bacterium]
MNWKTIAAAAALLSLAACDRGRGNQVRTYELHRLSYKQAETLLTPYIREGGYISGQDRLLSVRESPDRLDSIATILKRYDGAPQAVTLYFQVIEAGDFDATDPAAAPVVAPLRDVLRYRGYRLVRSVVVPAMEGGDFQDTEAGLRIAGTVERVTPSGPDAAVTLKVQVDADSASVMTGVSGAPGQTLVIGSARKKGGSGALIVAVRPVLGAMVAAPAPH